MRGEPTNQSTTRRSPLDALWEKIRLGRPAFSRFVALWRIESAD
jgi:hypothetical protein